MAEVSKTLKPSTSVMVGMRPFGFFCGEKKGRRCQKREMGILTSKRTSRNHGDLTWLWTFPMSASEMLSLMVLLDSNVVSNSTNHSTEERDSNALVVDHLAFVRLLELLEEDGDDDTVGCRDGVQLNLVARHRCFLLLLL